MTYNPKSDRDYWRCEPDADLIEAAKDSGHELCIALGERLAGIADVDERLTEALADLALAERRCERLEAQLAQYETAEED